MHRAVGMLLALALLVSHLHTAAVRAQKKVPGPAADLKLPEPMTPAAALASMRVPRGLKVELVAAEPLVMDPVDIAWGPDGKLWVVEMADYPLGLDGKGKPGGRVKFLEDTNGDGVYDRATLFLDGIPFPTGVLPWRAGVLVTAAPAIFYAEDSDGDGKADARHDLYVGFGEGNQQHRVNGLRWGLDNWIHVANGDSDGKIRSVKNGAIVDIRGRDLRIRPDQGLIDPQTGRAQFGRNRDDWDNWFGCNNSNPMWHYVLADHYLRRNPHLATPKGTVPVSDKPGAAPVFPLSKTLDRFNDLARANHFTSACGTMIYRDDLLGKDFAGNAFTCEPVHNLVHREIVSPSPRGVTFTSRRAADEAASEFLASADNWFRPTVTHTGPDGALYVVDMYRLVIEHPQWIPQDWQQRLDLRAGHDKGRIYRIVPDNAKGLAIPRLDCLDVAGLVAALESKNGWQRDQAQQMLLWRGEGEAKAVPLLRKLVHTSRVPLARLHALCTLEGLGGLQEDDVRRALGDAHPGVRRHALRLSEPFLAKSRTLAEAAAALISDADPQVRMQLAYSLGAGPNNGRVLGRLARQNAEDPYLLAAAFSSLHEANLPDALTAALAGTEAPHRDLAEGLLRVAAAMAEPKTLAGLLESLCDTERLTAWRLAALAGFLQAAQTRPALRPLLEGKAGEPVRKVLLLARELAQKDAVPEADRVAAIRLLGYAVDEHERYAELLAGFLNPRHSPIVQHAGLQALGDLRHPNVPGHVLAEWGALTPKLRQQALDMLLSRAAWTGAFLEGVERGKLPLGHLDAGSRQRLLDHKDPALKARAAKLLAGASNPDRKKVIEEYRVALTLPGDLSRGREVYKQRCAGCHLLHGQGKAVGPDLAALTNKAPEVLLEAIFDPNRAIEDRYVSFLAATTDGRVFTGMLASESATSVTLKGAEGEERTLLRSQLEELRSTGKSLMPEGLEKDVSRQQVAHLLRLS